MTGYDSFCCFRSGEGAKSTRILWELNTTCNLKCGFCHTSQENRDPGRSCDEIRSDLVRLSKQNVAGIIFSGGEPLLRNDLLAILSDAKDLGFDVDLCTNATLVTAGIARQLASRLGEVSVSLDSGTPRVHDRGRGCDGAHARATRGIALLQDAGLDIHAITVVNQWTEPLIEETVRVLDGLGINSVTLLGEMAMGAGGSPRRSWMDGSGEIMRRVTALRGEVGITVNTKRLLLPKNGQECPAGKTVLGIDARGMLHPCILFKGLRSQEGLQEWNSRFDEIRDYRCYACDAVGLCFGGCPGASVLVSGRIDIDPLCDRLTEGRDAE